MIGGHGARVQLHVVTANKCEEDTAPNQLQSSEESFAWAVMVLIKDLATREIVMVSVYGLTVVKVKSPVTRPMQINFLVCVSTHMNFSAASKYFIVRRRLFFQQQSTQK